MADQHNLSGPLPTTSEGTGSGRVCANAEWVKGRSYRQHDRRSHG
jgi:hypothetical protein